MAEPPALASAAPVFKISGTRQPDLARDAVRVDIDDTTEGLRTLTAHFLGSAPRSNPSTDVTEYLDGQLLDFGKRIEVSLGPPGNERIVFSGAIWALEVNFAEGDVPVVVVSAEDELMTLRLTQRSATYLKVSDADLVRSIASQHGFGSDTAADGPTYDVVQQFNTSDLAFLRERARRIQAELWMADGKLHLATRDKRRGTTVRMVRGSDLIMVSARADLAEQCTAVRVSGYDAAARKAIDAEAPLSTVNAEISGGRTGPQALEQAFGALPGRRVRDVPVVESEARAVAQAEMLRRSRRFVRVHGVTTGTPELVVASRLTLARCGRPFDGPGYYVTRVHHSYDVAHGMRTRFEAERPTVNNG